ncbi:hypothetical protein ACHAPI_007593 [Fusarium lateritium]
MAEPLRSATPTGLTNDQPAPDKTLTTFHRFAWLPAEIRIKIWKLACFPRSKVDRGIQYVTVNIENRDEEDEDDDVLLDKNLEGYDDELSVQGDEDGYITLTAPKRPRKKPAGVQPSSRRPNAAACLWDAGLQTACQESKFVVTEYYNFKRWLEMRERSRNNMWAEEWYDKDYPSALVPHKRDKKWCPMVVPRHDIFCIDTSRIQTLPKSLYSMKLLAPFLATRKFAIVESWNIALKFNRSWNVDFPFREDQLKNEKTPRGILANWLDRFQDEVLPEPSIWIIDDSVEWLPSPEQNYTPVYRDCDGDYVQADWANTRDDGARGEVSVFMKYLSAVLDDDDEFFSFRAKETVKLLVRKDKELSWGVEAAGLDLSDGDEIWNDGDVFGDSDSD